MELTDEQYISEYREGKTKDIEVIYDRYKNLVRAKASSMYILGGDEQDLIQEGMIGLFKAVRDYDFGRDASFATFADLCISRQIYNAVQSSGRLKHLPLNDYVSLTADRITEEGDESQNLIEEIAGEPSSEPETAFISQETVDEINHLIDTILTESERDVFKLHATGLTTSGIAAILSMEPKSADNALQRAKMKLKKALS
ncbi:MAG: sigma-70 family RNA polymerase sigma factor [Lachnospiraceae bacterium]|nr:sigma-70 family RNA polymerase sigma factor [Lachnospiraceae bacterium]